MKKSEQIRQRANVIRAMLQVQAERHLNGSYTFRTPPAVMARAITAAALLERDDDFLVAAIGGAEL